MGKITGSSWLAAVKRALIISPNHKDHTKSIRRGDDDPDQEEQAKRGKRRWIFMKSSSNCHHQETVIQHCEPKIENPTDSGAAVESDKQQRHVLAMAVVTTAAAQAAVATAQAAMEVARLVRPVPSFLLKKHHLAALCIQTAFRAYLARKALRALKGLVKLQALVRGHNVRKRAKMTLRCMQALVRVQDRVCDQRRRLSYEGSTISIDSIANSHSNNREKSYASREESSFENEGFHFNYNINAQTVAEPEASLQRKTRENVTFKPQHYSLANAFSRQMMIGGSHSRDTYASEGEAEDRAAGWPISSSRKLRRESNRGRVSSSSCDHTDASATNVNFKTVEIDTSRPYSCSYFSTSNTPPLPHQEQRRSFSVASPDVHRRCEATHSTRSPPKSTNIEAHSISPRCSLPKRDRITNSLPNYMAATASTKARIRSQSAPKQRVLNPDQSNSTARRRLKFPVSEPEVALTSKGLLLDENDHAQHVRVPDLRSNMSSCCTTESISPPISRTDLSRLLR